MNTTKVLLLGAVVAAFTFSSFAAEPLLSPRAKGNQINVVSSVAPAAPAITIAYVETTPAQLSPRAAGNQVKVVKGIANETSLALICLQTMNGSPKAVTECSQHANMPSCVSVAPLK